MYLRNESSDVWEDHPRYLQDVRAVAERFFDNSTGVFPDHPDLFGAIELILVRDAESVNDWNAPYEVLRKVGGVFSTVPIPTAIPLGLVNPSYAGTIVQSVQRLQDIRSGDIILFSAGMCPNNGAGHYFGEILESWHGSLCPSDMTIPIIFSFPGASAGDPALARFLNIVDSVIPPAGQARITDITPTVYKLLTGEDF